MGLKRRASVCLATLAAGCAGAVAIAADLPSLKNAPLPPVTAVEPWSGFYVGGHLGYAWGHSRFSTAGTTGSIDLAQPIGAFDESGSYVAGVRAGYNYLLSNRVLLGAEVDGSFPSFVNLAGVSVSGASTFDLAPFGSRTYQESVLYNGTLRGRIGYAPGDWLFYATGGLAWTRDQLMLTQNSTGAADSPLLTRIGWAVGAGFETPIAPNWTAELEYLYTGYSGRSVNFAGGAQTFRSDLALHQIRAGVNYHFGGLDGSESAGAGDDRFNFHAQSTLVEQAYPAMRSPYQGHHSLPGSGMGRETFDVTLYAGMRLWNGAELWINPEIDQGFGVGDARGVAGLPSGEAYKAGSAWPYARVQRNFVRQTVDLGGESQKVDADLNQFAGTQTANRLVLTVGRFGIVDLFDTNKYANSPKNDFLNWANINAGTFDYAGDPWGFTYGAAAEWYQGRWTLRGGVFDLSAVPAGGANNEGAYGLDPNFNQFQMVGEIEERHEFAGQPGKFKVTGFLSRGRAGWFRTAVDAANAGADASLALALDRNFRSRPGVSVNLEQQLSETLGVFARAGWADGRVEPWDFTDIDSTVQAGVSLSGKDWGRPADTVGLAGIINGIDNVHTAYFAAGGAGIVIGDGKLPRYATERIVEAYYNYALTASTKLGFDYQLIANPAYNPDRGPAHLFAGRLHWQY